METPGEVIAREVRRTVPDYILYVPESFAGDAVDGHNEHLLVFDGSGDRLMAVWTQSPLLRAQTNHICFATSDDGGATWSCPRIIAGPTANDDPTLMASWAFPMVSTSGRIYIVWNQYQGVQAWQAMHCGTMAGRFSDDGGATWSEAQHIPMPPTAIDDPEGKVPAEWIVWQSPERDLGGRYLIGFSHWFHPAVAARGLDRVRHWTEREAISRFMRFLNLDDDPAPADLQIEFSPVDTGLGVPHRDFPEVTNAHEPSLVRLPDDGLFCVMRTVSGYLWWSGSADDGRSWTQPRPLLYRDFGRPLLNPCGPAPIYRLSDGRYLQLFHNNAGDHTRSEPRNPLFVAVGEFRPDAEQPLEFGAPRKLMDTGGVTADGHPPQQSPNGLTNASLSMYSSFTTRDGVDVLWYPDRKTFLLGKRITPEMLNELPPA